MISALMKIIIDFCLFGEHSNASWVAAAERYGTLIPINLPFGLRRSWIEIGL